MSNLRTCFKCKAPIPEKVQICPKCCTDQGRARSIGVPLLPKAAGLAHKIAPLDSIMAFPSNLNWPNLTACAVCNPDTGFSSVTGTGPRAKIVTSILTVLRIHGSYSAGGLGQFWQQHRDSLCPSCQAKLDGIDSQKKEAMALLEESVRLDSKNEPARKNLAALRGML